MKIKLTPKQRAFVGEYVIDSNGTQAAIRDGYSLPTANRMGSENLSKPVIADAIREATEARAQRTEIDADWVQAKTQAECYDYLFGAAVRMRQMGIDPALAPEEARSR